MTDEQFYKRKKVVLDLMNDKLYVPMKIKELVIMLQVSKEDRPMLEAILDELLTEHKIEITKRGKYKIAEEEVLEGVYTAHPKGFGFVEIEDREEDVYIPEGEAGSAMHGDKVQVVLLPGKNGKRQEGKVTKVLERAVTEVVGTFEKSKNYGFVVPDNAKFTQDIFIPLERSKGAMDGHKVLVELTTYGTDRKSPEGKVTKIIGHINDPGTDILSIVYANELPTEFPERVLNQAERVREEVTEADREGRLDLRGVQMVTIDGEDAKDLDDAVSLTKEDGIWHLGVHIADVSNYVQENSALDWEARERGTSIYLVDRVIPMIPHRLSNGICSLNEGQDRLALSCMMDIDEKGEVIGHQIAETVICTERRMTYTAVKKILEEQDAETIKEYENLVPMFKRMEELAGILRENRRKRGSIDFDFPETKMILDKAGVPVEIRPYDRNVATKIIEDFMLIANETVAEDYFWQEIPFVYRTHDNPDPERIQALAQFIANFGYGIKGSTGEIHPKELQKLLARAEDSPEQDLISRLTLRSMKQAKYSTECTGHFGLAARYYCHFTSPIRRYPDLQIHRIIKETLRGRMDGKRLAHYTEILPEVAEHSSKMERRADEAERETNKLKKAEYMKHHIGEEFFGIISGMNSWGMYVELENTIEGLVHVSNMVDDHYSYHEDSYEMTGSHTGKVYKLGQRVKIRVLDADKQTRNIDFILASDQEDEWGE